MAWLKLTSKALYLMQGDQYIDKQDLHLSRAQPEQYKFDFPKEWMSAVDAPRNLIVALETTAEPQPLPSKKPDPFSRPYLRVVRTGKINSNGLAQLDVDLMDGEAKLDGVPAVSGLIDCQAFRLPSNSRSGSYEPLPEGVWDLGLPRPNPIYSSRPHVKKIVEFASGSSNDFTVDWPHESDGIGPVWIEMTCKSNTGRIGIGIHCDNNAPSSAGTSGCIGIARDAGYKTLRKFVSWFADPERAPQVAIVDWGLGTVPK
jgi:lysozyme